MGNGKLGSGNPGSFADSTVILLFIWNVDMQQKLHVYVPDKQQNV